MDMHHGGDGNTGCKVSVCKLSFFFFFFFS